MWIGAGAARWSRLAVVAMLAILVPLASGVVSDDVGAVGLTEQLGDDGLARPVDHTVGAIAGLVVPPRVRLARLVVADDPVSAGWTGLTPTDRAPPRV